MEIEEFEKIITEHSNIMKIKLNRIQIEKLYEYMNLLIEWNEKFNLTAIVEPKEIIIKHFIDSLTILEYIPANSKVIDVGSGAGFPGIPLKICRDDIDIILLDSLNKRIGFLNEVISSLELNNIKAIHSRAEDFVKENNREKFDVATSRAVANLSTLAEYLMPYVKIGGKVVAMKGSSVEEELNEAKKAINILGGKIKEVKEIFLVENDIKRNIVIIDKKESTPNMYPRKAGTALKKPIK